MRASATIEAMAYAAFRRGGPTEAERKFAAEQIEARGLRPIIERVETQIARAFAPQQKDAA